MRPTLMVTTLGAALAATVLATSPAMAGNGHFIGNATSVSGSSLTTLTVSFKEAGLESGATEHIVLSAHADATYQCVNGGKKNPNAGNKTSTGFDFTVPGEFTAAKNGNVVGSLSASVPLDDPSFSCPSGQTETLSMVTWSNIGLDDLDSGASIDLPGTYSFGSLIP